MDVEDALIEIGGVGARHELEHLLGRNRTRRLIRSGRLARVSHGHYSSTRFTGDQGMVRALSGTAHLLTAAIAYGWKVKTAPAIPQVAVRRGRKVAPGLRRSCAISWRHIPEDDRTDGWITSPVRTVIDCARVLPFDEALAVADSALRSGVAREDLLDAARTLDASRRERVLRVIEAAAPEAANPFESVLRALCLQVPGLSVIPQLHVYDQEQWIARVDLGDGRLRLVIEADSLEFHRTRAHLDRDSERAIGCAIAGWVVVSFTWTQVMLQPDWVVTMLRRLVRRRHIDLGLPLPPGL